MTYKKCTNCKIFRVKLGVNFFKTKLESIDFMAYKIRNLIVIFKTLCIFLHFFLMLTKGYKVTQKMLYKKCTKFGFNFFKKLLNKGKLLFKFKTLRDFN